MEAYRNIKRSGLPIVTRDTLKEHLHIYNDKQNDLLDDLLVIGTNYMSVRVGYSLNVDTIDYYFPYDKVLTVSDEFIEVQNVRYIDENYAEITVQKDDYRVDKSDKLPIIVLNRDFPVGDSKNPIIVEAKVIPAIPGIMAIKLAIILYVKGVYNNNIDKQERAVDNILYPFTKNVT